MFGQCFYDWSVLCAVMSKTSIIQDPSQFFCIDIQSTNTFIDFSIIQFHCILYNFIFVVHLSSFLYIACLKLFCIGLLTFVSTVLKKCY